MQDDDDRGPFEMLARSHERLRERLDELERAAAALGAGSGREAAETIEDVLGYLGRSAARHERDEEESLFPRLRGEASLGPVLDTLAAQHREHERLAEELGAALDRGREDDGSAARLLAIVQHLKEAYEAHVALEESSLFPRARELLGAADLEAIGAEMQARRGRGPGGGRDRDGRRM